MLFFESYLQFEEICLLSYFCFQAILVVGDAMVGRGSRTKVKSHKMTPPSGQPELSISHILGTSDILAASRDDLLMELR